MVGLGEFSVWMISENASFGSNHTEKTLKKSSIGTGNLVYQTTLFPLHRQGVHVHVCSTVSWGVGIILALSLRLCSRSEEILVSKEISRFSQICGPSRSPSCLIIVSTMCLRAKCKTATIGRYNWDSISPLWHPVLEPRPAFIDIFVKTPIDSIESYKAGIPASIRCEGLATVSCKICFM